MPVDEAIERAIATIVAACAEQTDRDAQLCAGLRALLGFLDEHRELAWQLVGAPAPIERRAGLDARLAAALPVPDPRTVTEGWAMVHERLWRYDEPQLLELDGPLLALIALRSGGLLTVAGALQAAAIAA